MRTMNGSEMNAGQNWYRRGFFGAHLEAEFAQTGSKKAKTSLIILL